MRNENEMITAARKDIATGLATLDQANALVNQKQCSERDCTAPARVFVSVQYGNEAGDWDDDSGYVCPACADSFLDKVQNNLDESARVEYGLEGVWSQLFCGDDWYTVEDVLPPTYPDIIVSAK